MSTTYDLQLINKALKQAIASRDTKKILALYEDAYNIDIEKASFNTQEEYDLLVDQANDVLFEEAA